MQLSKIKSKSNIYGEEIEKYTPVNKMYIYKKLIVKQYGGCDS